MNPTRLRITWSAFRTKHARNTAVKYVRMLTPRACDLGARGNRLYNVDFGNYISAIYPPELQLTDTSTSSTEVCYLDTHIKTGDTTTPFRISIYDKRDDFTFQIVNFPHMDSNIPANPAYGVYISQLVRYARICTSKVDFMNRFRGLSLRLRQQGFLTKLLQRTFTKFFNRHGLIVEKYG